MGGMPFDASLKDLIEEYAPAWAERFWPGPVLDAEVIDADVSTVTAASDKVIRVRSPDGESLLDIEVQSSYDAGLPRRLLLYSDLLNYRHGLPVRSVVVLLRKEANAGTMTGIVELRHAPADEPYHWFRYTVVRLWQQPLAPLLAGPVGLLPLAPLTDDAEADLPGVVDQVIRRLRAETSRTEAAKMEVATFILMGMRYEEDVLEQLYKGVPDMEESSGYQLIMKRGERKALIGTLLRQGRKKFGEPDATTLAAVERLTDVDRLQNLTDRILEAATWQELLS
jgi:predicted transposase YdaD